VQPELSGAGESATRARATTRKAGRRASNAGPNDVASQCIEKAAEYCADVVTEGWREAVAVQAPVKKLLLAATEDWTGLAAFPPKLQPPLDT
jgi:hypothetical protein